MLAAAKVLGVNQSTVQRRLAELEKHLGRRLITRHLTGYRLTKLGQELQPSAERVEEVITAFERHLSACDKGLSGTVRVTMGPVLADRFRRTPLIDAFQKLHPSLRLELVISDRLLDLSKGEADVAIRAGNRQDDNLVGRKVADAPWAVFASRSYIDSHGGPECIEDIERHLVVGCHGVIADLPGPRWLRSVAPNATVAARCDNWSALVLAVRSGAGIAPLLAYQQASELVRVIDNIELKTPFFLLMHRDMQRTPRVRAFADFVTREIKTFRALVCG